ncbi:MAG: T9SS type A sorting domain-containing protein, partial [Aureispira sp.]|nr:T9SS type A sorting domain-containing protein [Aureispira sp.]
VIDSGLTKPCGVDLIGDRLIVGDYTTGDIRFYDISVNPVAYLGKIGTGAAGLTGIKVGPEGNIWFTNRLTNLVQKVTPSVTTSITAVAKEELLTVYPNPASSQVTIQIPSTVGADAQVSVTDALGRVVLTSELNNRTTINFNTSNWANGVYLLSVQSSTYKESKMIQISK